MPNYEYNCSDCGYQFVLNKLVDERDVPTKEPCPVCEKTNVKRAIGLPRITSVGESMFKKAGDGWKEIQQRIKAASGSKNTIRTK
jgi:putative FmdB family regulatory protein